MKIIVGILLVLSISQCFINVESISENEKQVGRKDIKNVFNAIAAYFKLNTTIESLNQTALLEQILDLPDDLNVLEFVVIGSQNFFLFYTENYNENIAEYWGNWVNIINVFIVDGTEGVTLEQLKPFILLIGQKNSTFAPIVDAINEYLYEDNLGNQSFIDLLLSAPNDLNLYEIIVISFQNYFLLPIENAEEKPENYDEIRELLIEVLNTIKTDPEEVTMKQLKPIIEFIWNYFLFPPISISTTTTTEIVDSTTLSTETTSPTTTILTSINTQSTQTVLATTNSGGLTTNTVTKTTKPTVTSTETEVAIADPSGLSSVELGIVIGTTVFIVIVILVTAVVVLYIYRIKSTKVSIQETDTETTV